MAILHNVLAILTRRWNPSQGGGILHEEVAILHEEVAILHEEVAILHKEVAILHMEVAILHKEVAILHKGEAILHKEVESLRSKGINIFNQTRKNFKNKKEETSMPSVSPLIKSPIQILTGPNWLDIESPFMSTFFPLDHISTKLRHNSHSKTMRRID